MEQDKLGTCELKTAEIRAMTESAKAAAQAEKETRDEKTACLRALQVADERTSAVFLRRSLAPRAGSVKEADIQPSSSLCSSGLLCD
jgi:hypothetical protein